MKRVTALLTAVITLLCAGSFFFDAGAASEKTVAITFDDGPSIYTATLLDGLKSRGAKATFFCTGTQAAARPELLKRVVREGHQLANHTQNHKQLTKLSRTQVRSEIRLTRDQLVKAGGEHTYYIRPPYGSYNDIVREEANAPLILWSVDTLDWKYRNVDTVYNNIINQTKDGSIILLHDLYKTSVEGALRAISTLQKKGYEFVTVEELFARRGITPQKGKAYGSAPAGSVAAATPEISVKDVWGGKQITVTCKTQGATLYYTIDGSTPTTASPRYSGAFVLKKSAVIKAIAVKGGRSGVISKSLSVPQAAFADLHVNGKKVTLTTADQNARIFYTTDGSAPSEKSTRYTGAFTAKRRIDILVQSCGRADRRIRYDQTQYGDWFHDVSPEKWYYQPVGEMVHQDILKGVGLHTFDPDGEMTRAMFVTALARFSGERLSDQTSPFTDVPKNSWYATAVAWAAKRGIVQGMSRAQFAPDQKITREQMCTMMMRFAEDQGITLSQKGVTTFADAADISRWALQSVSTLHCAGVINGMGGGRFAPQESATRAQCAKILTLFAQKAGR